MVADPRDTCLWRKNGIPYVVTPRGGAPKPQQLFQELITRFEHGIVVNDCPGFLVNRVLLPYFGAFMGLVRRGVDFTQIDRAMERFGWPMGPIVAVVRSNN